jgi:hypothetical protein
MGMLFNTDATMDILKVINGVFNKNGLKRIRENSTSWQNAFNSLPNGTTGTYATINGNPSMSLNIDLDGGKGLRSANWQIWLKILDKTTMTPNPDTGSGSINVSNYIGVHIKAAIADTSFTQIEFFAVPGKSPSSSSSNITAVAAPYSDGSSDKSLIVTVNTATLDLFLAANLAEEFSGHHRRRRR